jgi:hypothetical protein
MTLTIPGVDLGQAQQCSGVKTVNEISTWVNIRSNTSNIKLIGQVIPKLIV